MTTLPSGRIDFSSPVLADGALAFPSFERTIAATAIEDVAACLDQVERALAEGFHALGFISFEAAPAFDPALAVRRESALPLLWFGLSRTPQPADPMPSPGAIDFPQWVPGWNEHEYTESFDRVQRHIADGDTYQLNLTFPLRGRFHGGARSCYAALHRAQRAKYSALLETADWAVVSASPELFFERLGTRIQTRPMKGTRPRGMTTAEDREIAAELCSNPKDRAENVMIVDLLRNDLGRIAVRGSVSAPELFVAEKYPTVWQMTSTVTAEVRPDLGLYDLFAGIFPCGSVTGAPKVKTMEIIAVEEPFGRGVYCGAVGYLHPNGDAVFNVAIRTLTLQAGAAEYPVGSGLVADSKAAEEYEECLVKAAILTHQSLPPFDLLETLRWTPGDGYFLLDRHLDRLLDSAEYFCRSLDRQEVLAALQQATDNWQEQMRVRLLATPEGRISIEAAVLPAITSPFSRLRPASAPVARRNPFLYHKTTHRDIYAVAAAERTNDTDVLLYNEQREITESTIANVAVCFDGIWYTPPISCGLLAGTMRRELLEQGQLQERVIRLQDMATADGVALLNSVRGMFEVDWVE